MRSPQWLLSICVVLGLTLPAAAGVTVTLQGGKDKQSTIYVEGNKMRIESNKGGDSKDSMVIFDGDQQKMFIIEPEKKTYSEITPQSIRSATDRMQKQLEEAKAKMTPEQRKQLDEMMSKMPPEQRQMMGKYMGEQGKSAPPVKKEEPKEEPQMKWERTGTKQTVAGYPCEGFREIKGGKPEAEGCYIPWSAGAITKADLAPIRKMDEFMKQSGANPSQRRLSAFAQLEQGPGFPAVWKPHSEGGSEEAQTVTSIKRGGVSSEKFQVPTGYTKSDAFGGTH